MVILYYHSFRHQRGENMKTKTTEVSFKASRRDTQLVMQIVTRAFADGLPLGGDKMDLEMDLLAIHANGCPLDFAKLLAFDAFNFAHDVMGIRGNIDRETGELRRFFLPRCSKPARSRFALVPLEGL